MTAPFQIRTLVSMPFEENTYVAWLPGRGDAVVIDPGLEPEIILGFLREEGLTAAAVLNTHGHADHIAGNEAMKQAFPTAPLVIGARDVAADRRRAEPERRVRFRDHQPAGRPHRGRRRRGGGSRFALRGVRRAGPFAGPCRFRVPRAAMFSVRRRRAVPRRRGPHGLSRRRLRGCSSTAFAANCSRCRPTRLSIRATGRLRPSGTKGGRTRS